MHAIGRTQEGDVGVVVDDEERGRDQHTHPTGQGQERASGQRFVTQLDDVGPTALGGGGDLENAVRLGVGGDDVEVGGRELELQVRPPHPALRATFPTLWGSDYSMRSGAEYTLKWAPRRNPTRVWLNSRASATARLDGAPTAARTGMPALMDFCTIS